jgi:hypothetical protein
MLLRFLNGMVPMCFGPKKVSSSRLLADLTTRNRTKDTLISDELIYSQMLCQLSYGEPEAMSRQRFQEI